MSLKECGLLNLMEYSPCLLSVNQVAYQPALKELVCLNDISSKLISVVGDHLAGTTKGTLAFSTHRRH